MKAITGFVFSHVALLLHILTSTQCSLSAETLMTAVSMSGVAFCYKLHLLLTISSIPFFFFYERVGGGVNFLLSLIS